MKKVIMLVILIAIAAALAAIRVETSSGAVHKGELTKKVGNLYFIKTNVGNVTVFQEEVTKVISDSGADITQQFIAMPATEQVSVYQPSPHLITNLNQIATPLWVFTLASIGYYVYIISKIE